MRYTPSLPAHPQPTPLPLISPTLWFARQRGWPIGIVPPLPRPQRPRYRSSHTCLEALFPPRLLFAPYVGLARTLVLRSLLQAGHMLSCTCMTRRIGHVGHAIISGPWWTSNMHLTFSVDDSTKTITTTVLQSCRCSEYNPPLAATIICAARSLYVCIMSSPAILWRTALQTMNSALPHVQRLVDQATINSHFHD